MVRLIVCLSLIVCLATRVSGRNLQRTIVAIELPTEYGENMFLRGGDRYSRPIPIINYLRVDDPESVYAQTSRGDNLLDWGGAEVFQHNYTGSGRPVRAAGTPMIWTTNNQGSDDRVRQHGHGYSEQNEQGDHVWMADILMDCDQTTDGWFDFKGYVADMREGHSDRGWEGNVNSPRCTVNGADNIHAWTSGNHHGRCGHYNLVSWSSGSCVVSKIDIPEH